MASDLQETLINVAQCLNLQGAPWLTIGGTALALHDIQSGPVKDIDIVLPTDAALRMSTMFGWKNYADDKSDRFRSDVVLRPDFGPVPVELLGGFQVRGAVGWVTVECTEGNGVAVGEQTVLVPTLQRLADIFRLCGRAKDIARADLIDQRIFSGPGDQIK
jgi:hypothetical protein